MEKIPKQNNEKDEKLVIGDQTFERVGEVEAQPTNFRNAPQTEEVYFDIENGALASKLPEDHPSKDYKYEMQRVKDRERGLFLKGLSENLDIDISNLSRSELEEIIKNEKDLTVYGLGVELGVFVQYGGLADTYILFYPKSDAKQYKSKETIAVVFGYSGDAGLWAIGKNQIEASYVAYRGHYPKDDIYKSFTFSFHEVPEGYKKLMEKKKVKGTGESVPE